MDAPHPLAKLIDAMKSVNGWSDVDISNRAAAAGYPKLSKSNVSRLRNEPVESVSIQQVRSLSVALGVTEQVVAKAFLAAMGVQLEIPDPDVADAIKADRALRERDKEHLLNLWASMAQDPDSSGPVLTASFVARNLRRKTDAELVADEVARARREQGIAEPPAAGKS